MALDLTNLVTGANRLLAARGEGQMTGEMLRQQEEERRRVIQRQALQDALMADWRRAQIEADRARTAAQSPAGIAASLAAKNKAALDRALGYKAAGVGPTGAAPRTDPYSPQATEALVTRGKALKAAGVSPSRVGREFTPEEIDAEIANEPPPSMAERLSGRPSAAVLRGRAIQRLRAKRRVAAPRQPSGPTPATGKIPVTQGEYDTLAQQHGADVAAQYYEVKP